MRKLFEHFALLIVIFFMGMSSAYGESTITTSPLQNGKTIVYISLDDSLTSEILLAFQHEIEIIHNPIVIVFITSRGGNLDAALVFGRFLRKVGASITVTEKGCYSSCVMILAAGTHRMVMGPVGIHRPYSTNTSKQTFSKSQNRYRVLQAEVKKYLFEMNLPESLFDAMVRVPPESIHILTGAELERFGLSQADPVAQEIDDADEAREFGLTKEEYLRRKALREQVCQDPSNKVFGPTITNDRRKELIDSWLACRNAVMQGNKPTLTTVPEQGIHSLILVCHPALAEHQPMEATLTIDMVNQTVNGWHAQISDTKIYWENSIEGDVMKNSINRLTGVMTIILRGGIAQGKCEVFSQAERKF